MSEIEFERDCELWDAYNRDFEKVSGVTLVRGDKIPGGLFHLVCDIIVRHTDGQYLLMQRDFYLREMKKAELVTQRIQQFIDELK